MDNQGTKILIFFVKSKENILNRDSHFELCNLPYTMDCNIFWDEINFYLQWQFNG